MAQLCQFFIRSRALQFGIFFKLAIVLIHQNYQIMEATDPSISNLQSSRLSNPSPINNFGAFRELKQTEEQYQLLRNRIKILKLNDERNKKKIQNNQNKIQKLEMIKTQTQQGHQQMNSLKKARLESIQDQKQKNSMLKSAIEANFQNNYESLINRKVQIYEEVNKQTSMNEKKIEKLKLKNIQEKVSRAKIMAAQHQKSKQNIANYGVRKTKTIHEDQAKQNEVLNKKKDKKRAEIQELQKVEMEMMKKYSESHIAFKNVKNKLDQMLGKIQNTKNLSQHKDNKPQSFYGY